MEEDRRPAQPDIDLDATVPTSVEFCVGQPASVRSSNPSPKPHSTPLAVASTSLGHAA